MSAPIASWPSSIRRPTRVDQMLLNISCFHARALRQESAQDPDREAARAEECAHDQRDRERVARPFHAERLREPEHAEAAEHRPDAELQPVLGNHRERLPQSGAESDHEQPGGDRANGCGGERGPAGRTERDHDERDLGPLEQDGLVCHKETDPIELLPLETLRAELGHLALVDQLLVVDRDDAGETKDRLAEPAQTEEQQECADDAFQEELGDDGHDRDTEGRDDDRERQRCGESPKERRTPSARDPHGQDDRGRFDELHRARDKSRRRVDGEVEGIHAPDYQRQRRPAVLSRPDPDDRGSGPYHPTVRRIDFIAYLVGLMLGAAILIASGYADRSPAAVRQGDFAQFWVGPRAFILGMDPYASATWHTTAVSLGAVTTDTSVFGYFGWSLVLLFFFFQAEDGIRDLTVTGVQTCALPICSGSIGRRPSSSQSCCGCSGLMRFLRTPIKSAFATSAAQCAGTMIRSPCRKR